MVYGDFRDMLSKKVRLIESGSSTGEIRTVLGGGFYSEIYPLIIYSMDD